MASDSSEYRFFSIVPSIKFLRTSVLIAGASASQGNNPSLSSDDDGAGDGVSSDGDGLGVGATVGIAMVAALVVGIGATVAYNMWWKKRSASS